MCTVSMLGDEWSRRVPPQYPWAVPGYQFQTGPTRAEFEALKAEVVELKKLLLAAKEYDAKTGQPDCEDEDKVALLKRIAELVGIDLAEVFGGAK